jgi:hypothetical protein
MAWSKLIEAQAYAPKNALALTLLVMFIYVRVTKSTF